MVAPISGQSFVTVSNTAVLYSTRLIMKQTLPIDRVLPYECKVCSSDFGSKPNNTRVDARGINPVGSVPNATTLWNQALSKAYDRFKAEARGQDAQLGVMLTEMSQSSSMLGKRLSQVANFGLKLYRRDFQGAVIALGVQPSFKEQRKAKSLPPRTKKAAAREFANGWLEYHFGWEPLVKDIYSAIEVLQEQPEAHWASGSASSWFDHKLDQVTPGYNGSSSEIHEREWGVLRYKMGAKISVSNKNLYLANKLGLVNPAVIVYENIPFSFIADWFFNVEQFLSQGTDFLGLSQSMAFTTRSWISQVQKTQAYNPGNTGNPPSSNSGKGHGAYMKRDVGIASPAFTVRPFRIFGWQRNLTAAALVTQLMNEGNPSTRTGSTRFPRVYNWGDSFRP